jgi:hypothetical protein
MVFPLISAFGRATVVCASIIVFALGCAPRACGADAITLTGREAAALRVAIDDFTRHHYSASGDFSHYTLKLRRSPKQLDIDFIPDTEARGVYPGGGTIYGPYVSYTVFLKSLKIVTHPFGQ